MKFRTTMAVAALLLGLSACTSNPGGGSSLLALPPPPPAGEPSGFIGLLPPQVQASFGKPTFTRRENGSELWRYDNGTCRVFLFFYSDGKEMSVRHVETLPQGKRSAADPACLTLLRERPASPTS